MPRKTICLCTLLLAVTLIAAQARDDDKAHKITIQNLKYDPSKLTIKLGQTVEWTNGDDNDHTVTSDEKDQKDKPLFNSENLGNADKFRHTFAKAGKFSYHCKYHPRMKGVVIVTD